MSQHLLTGGLFTCAGCGSNMVRMGAKDRSYYRCGAHAYRRGLGCSKGVYLAQEKLEDVLLTGLQGFFKDLSDAALMREVNAVLHQRWVDQTGYDPEAQEAVRTLERKLTNLRSALEEADDAEERHYLRERIAEVKEAHTAAQERITVTTSPLQLYPEVAAQYCRQWQQQFSTVDAATQKAMIREVVQVVRLYPEEPAIEIIYRVPDQTKNSGSEDYLETEVSRRVGSGGGI